MLFEIRTPATLLIINPDYTVEGSILNRFPRTIRRLRNRNIYSLPHPEQPAYAAGTNPYSVIYSMSHPRDILRSVDGLSAGSLRTISRSLAHARKLAVPLHVFGVIDNESPFGNRRAFEETIRLVKQSRHPAFVHVGVWHPTPTEYSRGLEELRTLSNDRIVLASLFPVPTMMHREKAKKFIDGITSGTNTQDSDTADYVFKEVPFYFTQAESSPQVALIANHEFHGLDILHDFLQESGL